MSEEILCGEHIYVFDLDKIFDYINVSKDQVITEKEIVDNYDIQKTSVGSKTIKQVITPMDCAIDNIRYDLIKTLIIMISNAEDNVEDMPYGVKMAFNSLLSIGLIKMIK